MDFVDPYHVPIFVDRSQATSDFPERYRIDTRMSERDASEVEKFLDDRKMKYEALSWCWGKEAAEYAVLITERDQRNEEITYKVRVRVQLALALNYLRYRETLWIDATCINQDDPGERNHQVQMMSHSYMRAE